MISGGSSASRPIRALALVEDYRRTARDVLDRQMAERTRAFIDSHPDCLWRTCKAGHLTASAWVVNPSRNQVLLTHHRKLGKWLQLGGHADGAEDLAAVALREVVEESGISRFKLLSGALFDLDQHQIPARGDEPAHWHFDFRFLVEADDRERPVVSEESHDVAWIPVDRLRHYNAELSLMRMVSKSGCT
ncbi:MAG TPA: NUDIX hydrolase [Opitutaceae bacterium]|jgi:8-oxo-dGTP pyrophosphatase MutT (NUDIX family)|nr:NUDIX hydrolase [Opitutaceae bacterium]